MSKLPAGEQYVDPPEGYTGPNRWMSHSGFRIMVGPGRSPFLLNDINGRVNDGKPVIIMVSGPPGSGKSYWALRLAEMLDPSFDVITHVPMDRKHFLELIGPESPLDRGSVIVSDEAQFLMSSRRWFDETQKDLMDQLEAIRSKGLIIIIVALHIELMDVVVREHILNYFIYLEKPGLATIYRLFTGRFDRQRKYWRMGQTELLLPGYEECNDPGCLICKYSGLRKSTWKNRDKWKEIGFKPCMNVRAVYERRKREKLDEINKASLEKIKTREKKAIKVTAKDLAEAINTHIDKLSFTQQGRVDISSIQVVGEEVFGVNISNYLSRKTRAILELHYESFKQRKEGLTR